MAGTSPQIAIGFVYHSDLHLLGKAVESAKRNSPHVLLILDASASSEARDLAAEMGAIYVDGSRNGGYAWGVNRIVRAARDAGCDVVVASNPDVIYPMGAIAALAREAAHLGGFVYPLQVLGDGAVAPFTVHPTLTLGERMSRTLWLFRQRSRRRADRILADTVSGTRSTLLPQGVVGSGAVMVATADTWERSGGMDERFFLFSEDREFGHRLHKLGIPSHLSPVRVLHEGGFRRRGPSASAIGEALLSERIYWEKHIPIHVAVLDVLQYCGIQLRVCASFIMRRRSDVETWLEVLHIRRHISRHGLGFRRQPLSRQGTRISVSEEMRFGVRSREEHV